MISLSGIEIVDQVSALSKDDEAKVIPIDNNPICDLIFHDNGKIEIPGKIKKSFKKEALRLCPGKMVILDVNVYGEIKKLDLPQITFYLAALELEKSLFGKSTALAN